VGGKKYYHDFDILHNSRIIYFRVRVMVFNATFNNVSVIHCILVVIYFNFLKLKSFLNLQILIKIQHFLDNKSICVVPVHSL